MISRLFSREPEMRIFFATDIHGSETCWKKFLNAGKHYDAKAIILGGDMTGKALVPIVQEGAGRWRATLLENRREFASEQEVKEFEESVRRRGYYPFPTDPDVLAELESDEKRREELFHKEMLGTVERWMRMADEKLEGTGIECFVSPGNDDQFEVDEIVSSAERVRLAEGRVVEFGSFQMVSTGWANRTPWDTYREESRASSRSSPTLSLPLPFSTDTRKPPPAKHRVQASALWQTARAFGARTDWQHDARRQPDGTLTIFDNGDFESDDRSYGIVLGLDEEAMKATLVRDYPHPEGRLSGTQGNVQVLPNGNVFVGWGSGPLLSEFERDGGLLFDARFPVEGESYRAFRFEWEGRPREEPAIAAESGAGDEVTVYASWKRGDRGDRVAGARRTKPRATEARSFGSSQRLRDRHQGGDHRALRRRAGQGRLGQGTRHLESGQTGKPRAVTGGGRSDGLRSAMEDVISR